MLDEIEDSHNLGAIIRTAECAGAHGIIISKRRAVGLNYTVGKASAGAYEYMPVARVTNIPVVLDELKEKGCWIYGADMNGSLPMCGKINSLNASVAAGILMYEFTRQRLGIKAVNGG